MLGKESRDRSRVGLLLQHPDRQGLQPAVQLVGGRRREQATRDGAHLTQPRGPLRARRDDTAEQVAVTADVLRRRVQADRRAERQRLLEHRCGERVVDGDGHVPRLARHVGDVDEVDRRVAGRLDEHEARVCPDRVRHGIGSRERHAGAEQTGGEQVVRAAVEGTHTDDVRFARREAGEQDGADRCHPGRERDAFLGALHRGEPTLEAVDVRVPQTLVHVRITGARATTGCHLLVRVTALRHAGDGVGGRLIDSCDVHPELGEVFAARVDGVRHE